jgi:hypothetical protein
VKYDLERLGPFGFQDLAAALALRVFGATVRPMGRGRDGGRDMMTTDAIRWSADTVWTGTTVFQVKHRAPLRGDSDATVLARSILKELDTWASPESDRGDVPDQLVFVSNVFLSAVPQSGGMAAVSNKIDLWLKALDDASAEEHLDGREKQAARREREARRDRMARLRQWKIVDGNHLTGLLDAHQEVRQAVEGFLQPGDILAGLERISGVLSDSALPAALKHHARWALTNERRIYFDEAGAETKGFPVEEVVIDLPVRLRGTDDPDKIVRHVLDRGDRILRPSLAAVDKPRHLVMVGAPGNGKTTVSRFLVHAYRATFLGEDADLGEEHRKAVAATSSALRAMGRPPPAHRRWPLRVDLAQFAVEKATDPDFTLLTFMAQTLTKQAAAAAVTKAVLDRWLRTWPCFLILDGLDEVTEPSVRKGLIADVEAFVDTAESDDHDLLAIVTTRPTGYADDLPTGVFERVDLDDLALADALEYGRRVTRIRVPDDQPRRDGVMALLESAAREEALQRLLRTPLQVLIMTIIAESSREFAPSRYGLFWGYYTTIEQRERSKPLAVSRLIRDHAPAILDLHRRAGLLLQRRAETAAGADSALTADDLRGIAWHVLSDAGYKPSDEDAPLLDKIVTAATHRLVLLTPQHGGGLGFDVRSFQELMAALAVTTGTIGDAIPRLRRISASPHWRNTFLFATGRYFSEPQPHQKDAVTDLVVHIDENTSARLGAVFPVGPQLAAEILDDGMAAEPKYQHRFIAHALTALHHPEAFNDGTYARALMSAAESGPAARALVADGLRHALGSTHVPRSAAERVLRQIEALADRTPTRPGVLALTAVRRDPARSVPSDPTADWNAYQETFALLADTDTDTDTVLGLVGPLLRQLAEAPARPPADWDEDLQIYLSDHDVAAVVEEALTHVAEAEPLLIALVRHSVMTTLWRQPADPFG